ncbi:autotransporter-associated beta strand repeat-containing protein [Luteolibacter sp. SL250]|uniref:beta strand repeat-containing protein n=1 Tax=Luteolibacter sp. SL250 TaxID=2995170 RepID=UPI002271A7D7|nr:autotransporter-associated beta strand repeat-containing protein [Luteolibacter sp. SL250]WAC18765.1 autotransporter-associated beta strand repeat-containing protein [Luteolibacter sp. SL250]
MKPRRLSLLPVRALALATLSVSFSAGLMAAPLYWDGATAGSWNDVANWSTDPGAGTPDPAAVPGAGDVAHFSVTGQTGGRTINLTGDQAVQGIVTDNLTGTVTLRGGSGAPVTLTLGSGGINHLTGGITLGTAADPDKVNVVLAASQTWSSGSSGSGAAPIIVHNDVSGSTGSQTLTLSGINLGSYVAGGISDGGGTVSLTKEGDGIWELRGTNTYSGTTQVNGGILRVTSFAAASAASAINVADGATYTLRLGGTAMTNTEADTLRARINFASSAAFLGLEPTAAVNYGSNMTGNHGLMKTGSQTLTLSGDNTYTGNTVVTSGYVAFTDTGAVSANSAITVKSGAGVFAFAGGAGFSITELEALRAALTYEDNTSMFGVSTANGDFSYDVGMAGAHGFVKAAAGTLTFGGTASNTYTGQTRIAGGTLHLNKTGGATAVAGDILMSTGGLTLGQNNQIADTSVITATGGNINFSAKSETVAGMALSGGATFSTGNTGGGSATSTATLGVVTAADTSRLTVNSGGKITATSIALTGTNNTAGNILMGGGHNTAVSTLEIGAGGLSMTGQTIQVNSASSTQKGSRISLNGDFTGSGENLIKLGAPTSSLAELAMGTGERTFNITAGNTQIDLNVAGETLVKTGAGSLALTGNNTHTGLTKVNTGILRVLSNNALGGATQGTEVAAGGQVRLENNVTVTGESLRITGTSNSGVSAGLLNFSGNNVWTGGITLDVGNGQNTRISMTDGTLDLQGNILIDSGATSSTTVGLVLTGNGGTGRISGNISGAGNSQVLIKNGNSTWELTGTNTYGGTTRVDAGVLAVNSIANNLGSPTTGNSAIHFGEALTTGTLRYTGTGETTTRGIYLRSNDGAAAGGGVIEQAGTGSLIISGGVTSNTTTSDKTLTLQGSTSGTGELSGTFADTGGAGKTHLVKSGTGVWTLSGAAKAYEGTTTVTGGVLNVSTSLTQSTSITVTDGTFHIAADNVIKDDATVTLGSGAILQVTGFSDAADVLAVTGNAQLMLAGGNNSLSFADSSSTDWTGGLLAISGWSGLTAGDDEILFDAAGLTGSQLSAVTFVNPQGFAAGTYSAKFIGNELVPDALIPEPSTTLTLLSGAACLFLRRRRQ